MFTPRLNSGVRLGREPALETSEDPVLRLECGAARDDRARFDLELDVRDEVHEERAEAHDVERLPQVPDTQ